MPCEPIYLPINFVRQKNICGCGLAALEMIFRYYGAPDTQTEFLREKHIQRLVEKSRRGLSEGTIGTLALRKGFKVTIYGDKPHITKTFLKLGGRVKRMKVDKRLILKSLRRSIPPIVLIPKVSEAYDDEFDEGGHYVVVYGVDDECRLLIADPQYTRNPRVNYWDDWSSSLIEVTLKSERKHL
jgi:ABC-type bacteriocin/lantibiotic exporter with double-glycine peptidase domain